MYSLFYCQGFIVVLNILRNLLTHEWYAYTTCPCSFAFISLITHNFKKLFPTELFPTHEICIQQENYSL